MIHKSLILQNENMCLYLFKLLKMLFAWVDSVACEPSPLIFCLGNVYVKLSKTAIFDFA